MAEALLKQSRINGNVSGYGKITYRIGTNTVVLKWRDGYEEIEFRRKTLSDLNTANKEKTLF